jgi:hypothetical protein
MNRPGTGAGDLLHVSVNENRDATLRIDPERTYSLAELIDLAQAHNPEMRVAWEQARARAAARGAERGVPDACRRSTREAELSGCPG